MSRAKALHTGKGKRKRAQVVRRNEGGRSKTGVDYSTASKDGCSSGKWGWHDRAGADTLKRALREMHGDAGKGVRVYRCPECDRFHVGHMPPAVKRGDVSAADFYSQRREDRS